MLAAAHKYPDSTPLERRKMEDHIDPEVHERHQQRLFAMLDAEPDAAMGIYNAYEKA